MDCRPRGSPSRERSGKDSAWRLWMMQDPVKMSERALGVSTSSPESHAMHG